MNDRVFGLLRLMQGDLYSFLQNASQSLLSQIGGALSLSSEQIHAFGALHRLAQSGSSDDFESFLSELRHSRPGEDPLYAYQLVKDQRSEKAWSDARTQYARLLQGKRIVLVGPSQSVIGSGQGPEIEEYDLVVRLNFQWPVPPILVSDIGKRMDILYHCCNGDFSVSDLFTETLRKTRFICWERNRDSVFLQGHCLQNRIPSMDISKTSAHLAERISTIPNTGTVAITHLLEFELSRLYITGITFLQDAYYAGYKGKGSTEEGRQKDHLGDRVAGHSSSPQLQYFKQLVNQDSRIKLDSALGRIIEGI